MSRRSLLDQLAGQILALTVAHPVRVAIDGIDAAGKTTLADELAALIVPQRPVVRASADDFLNPRTVRYRRGRLSPDGYYHDAFNHPTLIRRLLTPLGVGGNRRYRTSGLDLAVAATAPEEAILLLDGVFLQAPILRPHWDWAIFLEVSFEEALARAKARDPVDPGGLGVETLYRQRYFPAQSRYLAQDLPRQRADIVIDNNDPALPAVLTAAHDLR